MVFIEEWYDIYMRNAKTIVIAEYELPISIKKEKDGGYVAQCTSWNECYAQGDTLDQVIVEISAVASSLLDLYKDEGLSIPLRKKKTEKQNALSIDLNIPIIVSAT